MATRMESGPGAPGAMMDLEPEEARVVGVSLAPREAKVPAQTETSATAVAARERASVEARFTMALHRPRDPESARLRILDACRRSKFAAAARYAKPVGGGKHVYGLSVRFAEEAGKCWGNLDVSAMIVFDDPERRIYRVVGVDLETNWSTEQDVIIEKYVERLSPRSGDEILSKRTNSQGKTTYRIAASEDALLTKVNAQVSKARRNVILVLIPADILEEATEIIIATLKNEDEKDPAAARKRLTDAFWGLGITPDQLTGLVGKPLTQINPAELNLLRTVFTAIRDGETTWDDAVAELTGKLGSKEPAKTGTEGLKERLDAKMSEKKAEIESEKAEARAPAAAPLKTQVSLYETLAGNKLWSDEERAEHLAGLESLDRETIGVRIDEMHAEIERREGR